MTKKKIIYQNVIRYEFGGYWFNYIMITLAFVIWFQQLIDLVCELTFAMLSTGFNDNQMTSKIKKVPKNGKNLDVD